MLAVPRFPSVRASERGSMLVDSTLAITVMVATMLTLYTGVIGSRTLSETSQEKERALQDVRALTEQMASLPIEALGDFFPHDQAIPDFDGLHLRDQRVRVVYENGDPTARPLPYEVVVTWTSFGGGNGIVRIQGVRGR